MTIEALSRGFLVVPLAERVMNLASRIAYRRTPLIAGRSTTCHRHKFFSFYFVKDIKFIRSRKGDFSLPRRAMVIVSPFSLHGWSNRGEGDTGFVHDLTPAHGPHAIEAC
jgi:hypothetical protein